MAFTTKSLLVLAMSMVLVQSIAINKNSEVKVLPQPPSPNNGFAVQSGYEGYLVAPVQKTVTSLSTIGWPLLSKMQLIRSLVIPYSSYLLVYGAKLFSIGLHLGLALLMGILATAAVCSWTSICTISSGMSIFNGQMVKNQVSELANAFMTPQNVEMASEFVRNAIAKYNSLKHIEAEQPAEEAITESTSDNIIN